MMRTIHVSLVLTLGCLAAVAVAQEEVDKIQKQICDRFEKVNSLSGEMKFNMEQSMGNGMNMKVDMHSDLAMLRKGDKMLIRQEGESNSVMKMGDNEQKMGGKMLVVNDGEFVYSYSEQMGQPMAMKQRADQSQALTGGCEMLEQIKKDNKLSYEGEDDVNGDKTWVLVAEPKSPQPMQPAKSKMYFRQKDGVMLKTVGFNDKGEQVMTMEIQNIKINDKVDESKFKFEAPEGVTVQDMTNMPRMGGGGK